MGILELALPATVLVALYAVVGGSLAWAIGLRGLWAVAAAPVFTTTVIGIASVITGLLGTGWSILPVLVVAAVLVIGIRVVGRYVPSLRMPPRPARGLWTAISLGGAAAIMVVIVCLVLGAPDAISQTFDNVFHLNAIRWIGDTGAASPLELGNMTSPDGSGSFYPSLWHATAALVVQTSGASIPIAVNAQSIVIAALVWPAGAMLLSRVLVGTGVATTVVAAIVSVSIPAFPLLPMDYGVLYPYQLSLALVPFALAAVITAASAGEGATRTWGWWAFVLAGSLPGLALAHPGGFVAWLALSLPVVAVLAWRVWCRGGIRSRILTIVAVVAYGGIGLLLLKVLRPPLQARLWPTAKSPGEALLSVASIQLYYPGPAFVVAALVLIGLVWGVLRGRTSAVFVTIAMWLIGALLYVIVIASPFATLRDALTGSWYNNWPRLAAVFAVALVPLAVLGGTRLVGWVVDRLKGASAQRATTRRTAAVSAAVVLAFVLVPASTYSSAIQDAHGSFVMNEASPLLSTDEFALLARIDDTVPEDAVILGNPYTGTSLAYAISGRQVVMRHILAGPSPDGVTVIDHLDEAKTNPEVCEAVRRGNIRFVLDFGVREVHGEKHEYTGLDHLVASGVVSLVDQEGDAKLYAVTTCGDR